MEREERRWCGRCHLNVMVSEADRMELQRIAPEANCTVVPNGVDIAAFRPDAGREEGIVFVGGLNWFPNRDALQYFCDAILPKVRAAGEPTPVRWLGGGASDEVRRHYRDRYAVELTGYVPDVRPYVRDAACYVVPLRVGGGTRLKILDAWAMGKAVVSTAVGCEGLAAEDGRNILIRDDPDGFGQAVCAVLRDAALRQRLGAGGRRTVELQYSWERIGESVLSLYGSLCESRGGVRVQDPRALPTAVTRDQTSGSRVATCSRLPFVSETTFASRNSCASETGAPFCGVAPMPQCFVRASA